MRKYLTIIVTVIMMLVMVAPAFSETQEQKENRLRAEQALAAAKARKAKREAEARKGNQVVIQTPSVGMSVEEKTVINLPKVRGKALTVGELMMLEAKISRSQAAVNILRQIVADGRPVTVSDRAIMLEVAQAEEAKRIYERLSQ